MFQTIREHVTIKPGGTIEIHNPELPVGARAEVIVMVQTPTPRGIRLASPGVEPCGRNAPNTPPWNFSKLLGGWGK